MKTEQATSSPDLRGDAGGNGTYTVSPLYAQIAQVLRRAILVRSIVPGAVLLEGPVAELLHATRTPVRQALHLLEEERLVSRFGGRGFVVGKQAVDPIRVVLTAAMLGVDAGAGTLRKPLAWEAIYDDIERDVVHLSVFGAHRLNEFELARHFGVGRLVARDVLLRLERLGLIEKDHRLRWVILPLAADRINHLYELRWLLEPAAVRAAVSLQRADEVAPMITRLRDVMDAYPAVGPAVLDALESDLHVELLSWCPNKSLLQSLERTRCVLTLSKHVLGATAPMPRNDPFMAEHLTILEAVAHRDAILAESRLRAHLEASCIKVMQRVEHVQMNGDVPRVPYVGKR